MHSSSFMISTSFAFIPFVISISSDSVLNRFITSLLVLISFISSSTSKVIVISLLLPFSACTSIIISLLFSTSISVFPFTVDKLLSNCTSISITFIFVGTITLYAFLVLSNTGLKTPSLGIISMIFVLFSFGLIIVNLYILTLPSSAVTTMSFTCSPAEISTSPIPSTFAFISSASALIVTLSTPTPVVILYSSSSLSNTGLISYPFTLRLLKYVLLLLSLITFTL